MTFRVVPPGELPALRAAWAELWVAASNAGGAIDFTGPIGVDDVLPLVDAEIAAAEGWSFVGVVHDDGVAAGFAVVTPGRAAVSRHWGLLTRVMVDPARQGRGLGRALVLGMHAAARDAGLEQLRLGARSGHGLEQFYATLGYELIGRHPGAIRLPTEDRDELLLVTKL